jgi:hypothetical protein
VLHDGQQNVLMRLRTPVLKLSRRSHVERSFEVRVREDKIEIQNMWLEGRCEVKGKGQAGNGNRGRSASGLTARSRPYRMAFQTIS